MISCSKLVFTRGNLLLRLSASVSGTESTLRKCSLFSSTIPYSVQSGTTVKKLSLAEDSRSAPVEEYTQSIVQKNTDDSTFFPDDCIGWNALHLSQSLCKALMANGYPRPAALQVSAIPEVLENKDVVIAAQTGSGKTLAYLVPLMHVLLSLAEKKSSKSVEEVDERRKGKDFVLILCPNPTLCWQVTSMARALVSTLDNPSALGVHCAVGGEGWPVQAPDIVVASLASLLNQLFSYDPRHRRRTAFLRDVKWVVVDEADMMLSGGYTKQMERLLQLLRGEEKMQHRLQKEREQQEQEQEGEQEEEEQALPWTHFEQVEEAEEGKGGEEEEEEEEENGGSGDRDEWEGGAEDGEEGGGRREDLPASAASVKARRRERFREYWNQRHEYRRSKQYIFVAATLPEAGKKSAGEVLKKLLPEAVWVRGRSLHCTNARLQEQWVSVTEQSRLPELVLVLKNLLDVPPGGSSVPRILVFVNTADAVEGLGRSLGSAGLACHLIHAELPMQDRLQALHALSQDGGVALCTDALSRGVDIPNVTHVVQAEFALSAVDYLHRVGRTARAGRGGAVINFYTPTSASLVAAVRQAKDAGQNIESAFSRRRSFRKKLKKYGDLNRGGGSENIQA